MKKNKYSGSSFDDFLKEEGIFEEVKTLAQNELAKLDDNDRNPEDSPKRITKFFQWFQHTVSHLVS